jgi:methylphosphotriester-DNA--protein-cysteine methyltransferase
MIAHADLDAFTLRSLIRRGKITHAGNKKLKIYGTLRCSSGNRMKKENRVFFQNSDEALQEGFRPCKLCLNK